MAAKSRRKVPTFSAQEAADYLGISLRTLDRYQRKGMIAPLQMIEKGTRRFRRSDVRRLGFYG